MTIVFQNCNILTVDYELHINEKYICDVCFSKDGTQKVNIDVAKENVLICLLPIYKKKNSNVLYNAIKVFFEWITLFLYLILTVGTRKGKVSDFYEYPHLYYGKNLKLDVDNTSIIVFDFKSSKINSNNTIKGISPKVKESSKIKILSNEETSDFDKKYIKRDFIRIFNIYNIFFYPFFIVSGSGIVYGLIKPNVPLLVFLLVLFIACLSFYLYEVIKCLKVYKVYMSLITSGDGSVS